MLAAGGATRLKPVELARRQLEDIALHADELPDRAALSAAADELARRSLAADDLFWCSVDFASSVGEVVRAGVPDPTLGAAIGASAADHPGVASYVTAPAGLVPRRISDVASDERWRATTAWRDVFAGQGGRFQLSRIVTLRPPAVGAGWIATRRSRDFTDGELLAARRLHPLLQVAQRIVDILPEPTAPVPATLPHPAADPSPLTPRELDVLALVAEGRTADAIGRIRGISPRTVRKHLEHIYDKLGAHDRLLAVDRARALGLLLR